MRGLALSLALLAAACASPQGRAPSPGLHATTWLYGTAEAAMLAETSFRALVDQAEANLGMLYFGSGFESALVERMEDGLPVMRSCDETHHRPAVVFDLDETLIWNMGFQVKAARTGAPYDPAAWQTWERNGDPVPAPGALEAVRRLRALGITPVFNSNRSAANAAATAAMLERIGLGEATHRETLWLEGDAPGGARKHDRRALIGQRFCVLAQAGDQAGDFVDAIDFDPTGERRPPAERLRLAREAFGHLWGTRWFLIPNPVYGRWNDPPLPLDTLSAIHPPEVTHAMDP
ncbi:MAG: HAD family acid phosphatase [Sphingomonadaceae bacterium]